jgi:hypothetical protein
LRAGGNNYIHKLLTRVLTCIQIPTVGRYTLTSLTNSALASMKISCSPVISQWGMKGFIVGAFAALCVETDVFVWLARNL